ncbi:HAD-superfamily hydrolase, partial [Diplocarpon rosae]
IDGVLLRSSTPLPGASKALAYLQRNSIPFILLTNGGGKLERERVQELSEKLEISLSEDNFVQSHTPFKDLLDGSGARKGLRDSTILVTGGDGDKCRRVAESYGFKHVVTPADIITAEPDIWPFSQEFSEYYKSTARPLPNSLDPSKAADPLKIDAIFVFNDPRDWALDIQIIIDLLMSKQGILGTYSVMNGDTTLADNGWQKDGTPKLYFSNPDLLWAAAYPIPRFGQGAFQAALTGVWRQATSQPKLHCVTIGKPYRASYRYAEKVLNKYRTELLSGSSKTEVSPLLKVFMIGDNPESDIRGSNAYDSKSKSVWSSILVKTGVYQDGTVPSYKPDVIVDDVLEGVKWALKERRWKGEIE